MAERKTRRKQRVEEEEAARIGAILGTPPAEGHREALSQRAGEAVRSGDPTLAKALEAALRHRGRVERATHGFHTYPAGLQPDAAKELVALGEGPVLDPFCGGGTVLIEALLAGRDALGLDISPVANLVARARTVRTTEEERTVLRATARRATEAAVAARTLPPVNEELARWYEPHTLIELATIKDAISKEPLLRAVFSAILVKTSKRESDTSSARTGEKRPPGTAAVLFHKKAREYARMLEALATAAPATVRARVHREDARELRERGGFGLVVTSPPYPGVYDYVTMQHLRLLWLGLGEGIDTHQEIGSRRQFRADRTAALSAWRNDTRKWVRNAARALDVGGRLVVVIGDGQVAGKRIDTYEAMEDAAKMAGLTRVARATVERWDEGVNTLRPEHAMMWEKRAEAPATEG
jgi:SAM-dependent methyltransferase